MRETAVQFAEGGRICGVLTEPGDQPPRAALGLVNAGFVPRFGPHRIYAQLARRLASHGIATLRFDLGGLGDSLPAPTGRLPERTRVDIGSAVDLLAARFPGAEFSLGGICSGAEDSFRYAEVDSRVSRVVLVDPFAYRTAGWAWRHLLHRTQRRTLRALGLWERSEPSGTPDIIDYQYMGREESARILRAMSGRASRMHFIYTAGRRETFNHVGQFAKMFPGTGLLSHVTVDFLPRIEHIQLLQEDRDALIDVIASRLSGATRA